MLDVFNTPSASLSTFDVFTGTSSVTLTQWQTWRKPRGCNWVKIIGAGGGGAGSAGFSGSSTGGGAGAGGGSGAQSTVVLPAFFVPDILYIQAGTGGVGTATQGVAGAAGLVTYVGVEPSTTLAANTILLQANGGSGGGASAAAAASTGGAAGTVVAITNMPLAGRGKYSFLAGQAGTAGGFGATGTSVTMPTTGLMVTGGAGGGGAGTTNGASGGNITGFGIPQYFPPLSGGSGAIAVAAARPGIGLFSASNYMRNYGGSGGGGGSNSSGGLPGAGGDGAPGSGGGGSGGATTFAGANTIAKAGNGGPGFVIIITW